jgi:hypothetical protein
MITWEVMRQRCHDPKHPAYKDYGARGIAVCERWNTFANFLADMGERPDGTTIDRKDGTKGYEPGNCRWATPSEQANNTRTNVAITCRGRTQNLKQWAKELGISHQVIRYRLAAGWSLEDTFNTPLDHRNAWHRGTRK